ncbi:hypothetical protein HYH03_011724 [Edaphochlamys debaryana]|uniref:Uncharacterized protein n=1 Tax=Edaphochlamys debaryana TaxID=47281 RepID=A0A835XVF4_9CHLO|nr:hypothetical protein HYH03_011724 [Edaphochlamys debaryana]|eukprot:KAG2489773.1 hypothetical protein HYH03_011724 [Edaphochlamys debaryana]
MQREPRDGPPGLSPTSRRRIWGSGTAGKQPSVSASGQSPSPLYAAELAAGLRNALASSSVAGGSGSAETAAARRRLRPAWLGNAEEPQRTTDDTASTSAGPGFGRALRDQLLDAGGWSQGENGAVGPEPMDGPQPGLGIPVGSDLKIDLGRAAAAAAASSGSDPGPAQHAVPDPSTTPGALFAQINRCRTWRDLRRLQRSLSGFLLPVHIPALLAAAAKRPPSTALNGRGGGASSDAAPAHSAPSPASPSLDLSLDDAAIDDAAAYTSFVWGLTSSTLRLARSRELPPRSLSTALWAVAKLPLDRLPSPVSQQHTASQAARPSLQPKPARGATATHGAPLAPQPARLAPWLTWAAEMLHCLAVVLPPQPSPAASSSYASSASASRPAPSASWPPPPPAQAAAVSFANQAQAAPRFSPQDLSMALWATATLDGLRSGAGGGGGGAGPSGAPRGGALPVPRGLLAGAMAAAGPQLHLFSPQAMSNTLWALARLRYRPPPAWLHAACSASGMQLHTYGPQALANTAAAFAQLEYEPPAPWRAAFLAATLRLWREAARAAPAMPLEAAGQHGEDAEEEEGSWRVGREQGAGRPGGLKPQTLALCLWAAARLGMQPGCTWTEAAAAAAARLAPAMNAADVASTLWSLGALRYGSSQPYDAASQAGGTAAPSPEEAERRCRTLAPLLAAWERWVGADAMEPEQLSACLVAAAHLGFAAAPAATFITDPAAPSTATADPATAPSGREGALVLSRSLAQRTLDCLRRRVGGAGPQVAANALWAASRLGLRPSSGWVAAVVGRFVEGLEEDEAGPQELANVWWALGRLRWAPPAEAAQGLLLRAVELAEEGTLGSGELAMALWGVGQLGLRLPRPLLDRLVRQVELLAAAEQGQPPKGAQEDGTEAPPRAGSGKKRRPRSARAVPPRTLVTLLRALSPAAVPYTSQRSVLGPALTATLAEAAAAAKAAASPRAAKRVSNGTAAQAEVPGAGSGGHSNGQAEAARQVALELQAAASLGYSFADGQGWSMGGEHRLAAAVEQAFRWVVLPHGNARDLAMSATALAAMRASLPPPLLVAATHRASQLAAGAAGAPAVAVGDLALLVYALGSLADLTAKAAPAASPAAAAELAAQLAPARAPLLAAVTEQLTHSSRARAAVSARDVSQIILGLHRMRLQAPLPPAFASHHPTSSATAAAASTPASSAAPAASGEGEATVALLRGLALATVRCAPGLTPNLLAGCLARLARMGAPMDPRAAAVLVGRMGRMRRSGPAGSEAVQPGAAGADAGPGTRAARTAASAAGVMVCSWALRPRAGRQAAAGAGGAKRVARAPSPVGSWEELVGSAAGREALRKAARAAEPKAVGTGFAALRAFKDGMERRAEARGRRWQVVQLIES